MKLVISCVVACLAGHAFGWWTMVAPQDAPPALFSVTSTVVVVAGSCGAPVPGGGARSSSQQVLPACLPPSDGQRVAELARSLGNDWRKCFRFVRDHVAYAPYFGFLRGAERTLLDMEGNDGDQSLLLVELLRACGHSGARVLYEPCGEDVGFVVPLYSHGGQFPFNAASWFGIDEGASDVQSVLNEVWMRLSATKCPVKYFMSGDVHYVKTSRFWVSLVVNGETHDLDPSFKPCRRLAQRDFAADMGFVDTGSLSSTGLDATLDGYCATLREAWTNASAGAADYVGASEIAAMDEDAPEFPGTALSESPVDFAKLPDDERSDFGNSSIRRF